MSAHEPGTWWAIERYDTERREWVLQWSPNRPCWPRLFTRRAEARAEVKYQRVPSNEWLEKHWRQRAVKVRVVRA